MAWRLARSLTALRSEVDRRWPNRSKASDGTVGDLAHASRPSDHNPNAAGVVRALDITAAGINPGWYAEHLRSLGAAGHPPLRNGGIVIYNRRIASAVGSWRWRPYGGVNPHDKHIHVSVGRDPAQYDSTAPWGIATHVTEDDFMAALSPAEQRELLERLRTVASDVAAARLLAASVDQRCARLEGSIHGTDDSNRHNSIWWQMEYLYGELLGGENTARLRNILRGYGEPS